jgi:hypothetical protein
MTLRVFNKLKRVKSESMNIQSFSSVAKKEASINNISVIMLKFFNLQLFISFKLLILEIKIHKQQVIFNTEEIIKQSVEKLS